MKPTQNTAVVATGKAATIDWYFTYGAGLIKSAPQGSSGTTMPLDASQKGDDGAMMARFASGDPAAARALTARLAPIVFAHARRMLGHDADAQDVTQEALMRLWKFAPNWRPGKARITTWLYQVTANLCIDRLRAGKKILGNEIPELVDESPKIAARLQADARTQALEAALLQLPDRQRQAVILRHIDDLSNSEISQIMEISIEAVESLLSRGKRGLSSLLTPHKDALGFEDDEN